MIPHGFRGVLVGLCSVGLVVGCSREIGTNFDLAKADQFKPGVTTYNEAVAQLGKPTTIRKYPDGKTGAAWKYAKGTAFAGGSGKVVGIVFDASGVMERVASRSEVGTPD